MMTKLITKAVDGKIYFQTHILLDDLVVLYLHGMTYDLRHCLMREACIKNIVH